MTLLTLDDVSLEIGDQPILRHADLTIEAGERTCVIGRNGAGKSTLFRLIAGELEPDSGEVRARQGLRISQLDQALPAELDLSVHAFVAKGLDRLARTIDEYNERSKAAHDPASLKELESLQRRIEAEGGWHIDQRVDIVLTELGLPRDTRLGDLSGGWQRRVSLARALVSNPELLLLDEPTNHLDFAAIEWLEDRIRAWPGTVLFITHDRAFLQKLATRIVEIDRARLTSWPGDYRNFLRRKEEALHAEAKDKSEFMKRLGQEEAWIRQGIKARRTRNEGRVRALEAMRTEYAERQKMKPHDKVRIHIEEAEEDSGRKVIELHNASYAYGTNEVIDQLSLKVMRGDRIGLVGNNGVGKSTLLRLMLGRLEPQTGTVKLGTNLETGYFDQMRRHIDPEKTVAEFVGDGREYIKMHGKDRHVIGYLRGFLFPPKRAMTKVKSLSGGERNRAILAKLFTRPTNLLVLDEPTNDLDVETLEVLEDRLVEYQGTLIVVSHDREFLDNVVTSILAFEADGRILAHPGGYSDWARKGRTLAETDTPAGAERGARDARAQANQQRKPGKLSYKYQRELDALPGRIDVLEREVQALNARISEPGFYARGFEAIQPVLDELESKREELDRAVERWSELEAMQQ